jgi:SMODS and SLOG-associating 2TM effector domain 3/SMODS and SLOG-associating 2TM effector domain 1
MEMMQETDYPALYRSADQLSLKSQQHFFLALKIQLVLLVLAAALSIANVSHWLVAVLQLVALLGVLACSIYLFGRRPDLHWYTGRAVAESIKTITWRYLCRAEPFQGEDNQAQDCFREKLRAIVDQNTDVAQALTPRLGELQITEEMNRIRDLSLPERKQAYAAGRIEDQLAWYVRKAESNRKTSSAFFWSLIVVNVMAVLCAILRIRFVDVRFWPTDALVAAAAGLMSWMQAKRFSGLAASYALAAHEIGIIHEQSSRPSTEDGFSDFVGDAENAFSREHTQWVARKDV